MERVAPRLTAASGLLFVALSVAGIALIGNEPTLAGDPGLLVGYLHHHHTRVLTTNALLSLANGALIIFVVSLRPRLPGYCRGVSLVAVGLLCAIGATTAAIPAALAHYGTVGLTPQQVHFCMSIYFAGNAFSAMPAALLLGSAAFAAGRGGQRAVAVFSGAASAVQLAMTFSLLGSHAFSPESHATTGAIFGLLTVWVAIVSVDAVRGDANSPSHVVAEAAG